MSDKTLFNQDLTLNSLTLNNSTASNASGYVASSSTFTGNSVSTSSVSANNFYLTGPSVVGNPRISGANDDIYAITQAGGSLILQTPSASCSLSTTATNYLTVPNISTSSLIIGSGANTVSLLCPTVNTLTVLNGSINANSVSLANTLTSGTVSSTIYSNIYYGNVTNLGWSANVGANTFDLPNIAFASTASTSAIVNINITGSNAQGVFVNSCFVTPTGNTSTLSVLIYNVSASPITIFEISFIIYTPNGYGGIQL